MLSRREFGGGLAAGAAMRRHSAESQAPPPAPAPATEPNLARILRTKKLRVGAPAGEGPYFRKEPKSGQWSGFCFAMAHDLAAALGVEVALSEANWADA